MIPFSPISPGPGNVPDPLQRHTEYYFPTGDTVFLVENTLFRVHRHFLERESEYFRDLIEVGLHTGRGLSDSLPLLLNTPKTSMAFADFLWVFYNSRLDTYEATAETWRSILELAHCWDFAEVKALAIRHLEKADLPDIDKIVLYTTYGIDRRFLSPQVATLIKRDHPLTPEEGRILGLELALGISTARETARCPQKVVKGAKQRVLADVHVSEDEIVDMVNNIFGVISISSTSDVGVNGDAENTSSDTQLANAQDGSGNPNTSPTVDIKESGPASLKKDKQGKTGKQ